MGKEVAKIILAYYKSEKMPWLTEVTVEAEEHTYNKKQE